LNPTDQPTKRLIFNADDYGLTAGVSQGILDAHLQGVVSSTTVMVGSPNVADSIRLALQTAPRLGMGLHLTLSGTGRPVLPPSEIPSLVREDGKFYPLQDWMAHYGQFDGADIVRELNAQVERFIQIAGRPPDHLDCHHHAVYRHAAGLRTLFDLAARYAIPIRRVWSDRGQQDSVADLLNGVPDLARKRAVTDITAILNGVPLPMMPDRFDDGFYDATATLGDLLLILTNLPEGVTEIMCHPGYADAALDSDYTAKREDEVKTLIHVSVREVIRAEGIDLITFGDLRLI
jgi:hypothetical protein